MERTFTFRLILVMALILPGLSIKALDVPATIHVATPGTLSTYIAISTKYQITNLTLTGDLNGTDIRYIREMAGRDYQGNTTVGKLSLLDLSDANIVSGGDSYYLDKISSDNSIGDYMFKDCSQLTSVSFPHNITSIGVYAFAGCIGIDSLVLPNSITSMEDYAFYACTGLVSVILPDNITLLNKYVFANCVGMLSIILPDNLAIISEGAFSGCSALRSVFLPNSLTSIGANAFQYCSELSSLIFPDNVSTIGQSAFSGCSSLDSIGIPAGITAINLGVFSGCSGLHAVTIPYTVTLVGWNAFSGCSALTKIHCKSSTPPSVVTNSFANVNKSNCKLYVSKWAVSSYRNAAVWGEFTNIMEEVITSVSEIQNKSTFIYTDGEAIVISGVEIATEISVFSESGTLLASIVANEEIIRMNVPKGHIYLIQTTDKTFKVAF